MKLKETRFRLDHGRDWNLTVVNTTLPTRLGSCVISSVVFPIGRLNGQLGVRLGTRYAMLLSRSSGSYVSANKVASGNRACIIELTWAYSDCPHPTPPPPKKSRIVWAQFHINTNNNNNNYYTIENKSPQKRQRFQIRFRIYVWGCTTEK